MTQLSYRIDHQDRLAELSGDWDAFAEANGGPHLVGNAILGRPLWDFLSDPTTVRIYRGLVARIRKQTQVARFRFRCDSPGHRRMLAMEMAPDAAGGVWFRVSIDREQERPPVTLLEGGRPRSGELLTVCSWCERVNLPVDRWVEVEEAVQELRLFEVSPLPRLSHGICHSCCETMMNALDGIGRPGADVPAVGIISQA
ncbi:MAG: hypothetical protein ABJC74_08700 [Gemmatimonadota bacterium]